MDTSVRGVFYSKREVLRTEVSAFRRDGYRPEADAQTATPRVSTWTTWSREKKPGKAVEGFLAPSARLAKIGRSQPIFEPETLAPTSGEGKRDDERTAREADAPLRSDFCEKKKKCPVKHVMYLFVRPCRSSRLAGSIGFDRWR